MLELHWQIQKYDPFISVHSDILDQSGKESLIDRKFSQREYRQTSRLIVSALPAVIDNN